jgi:hypothetical protein
MANEHCLIGLLCLNVLIAPATAKSGCSIEHALDFHTAAALYGLDVNRPTLTDQQQVQNDLAAMQDILVHFPQGCRNAIAEAQKSPNAECERRNRAALVQMMPYITVLASDYASNANRDTFKTNMRVILRNALMSTPQACWFQETQMP